MSRVDVQLDGALTQRCDAGGGNQISIIHSYITYGFDSFIIRCRHSRDFGPSSSYSFHEEEKKEEKKRIKNK